jgi:predicted TIM-barrel fold metal-dependent hydrolase
MIIDCHCHAGPGSAMSSPWTADAPLGKYLRRARRAGIGKTIVLPVIHRDYNEANAQLARAIARYPRRLIGFAFVHARRDAGRIREMVGRAVSEWGFRGIKVHGAEAMPSREVCEVARDFGLPVLVDVANRAEVIDLIAPAFPQVNFIVAHLGSFMDDWKAHQQVAYQLGRYPNVYSDTSGVRRFDYLVEAVRRGGTGKVLFGSDGPWMHPGLELHKIRLLGLSPRQEARILGGNIASLLRRKRSLIAA